MKMKPTVPMILAMRNIRDGNHHTSGLNGRSQFGGHAKVMRALRVRKWIKEEMDDDWTLTDEGRQALAEYYR